MSDSNETKTKAQLLAEIEALRKQLAAGDGASGESSAPSFSRPITRREALANWIAPVILSVPVVAAMRSGTAQAAPAPAPAPTQGPVPSTSFPTQFPSPAAPTMQPTVAPTAAPTVSPTAAPTVSPTAAPEPQAVPGLGIAGIAVLGGALAVAGAKLLKDRADASDADAPEDDSNAG